MRKWTTEEVATLRRMARAGYSDGEIAGHLVDRCREVVRRKRCEMNIQPGRSPALTAMMARIHARRMLLTFQCSS